MARAPATSHRRRALLAVAVAVSLAGCSILGIGLRPERQRRVPPDEPVRVRPVGRALVGSALEDVLVTTNDTLRAVPIEAHTFRQVAQQAMPAVVAIYTRTARPYRVSLLPIPLPITSFRVELPGKALGSAFFIHPKGFLLTNNHVIENARAIRARTSAGADHRLVVVARDRVLDVALLRVAEQGPEFPYVPLGDSDVVGVGDMVLAIGNPLGLGHTVTRGIISQQVRATADLSAGPERRMRFLLTDTLLNPGSSGGPLITLAGAAIGINTAIVRGAQGISFTVPSSHIEAFVRGVLAGGGVDEATAGGT